MRSAMKLFLFAAVVVLLLPACRGRTEQVQPRQGGNFTLEVTNPMPHAMNVSYSMGGVVSVLGTVNANSTRTFTIPDRGGDEISVIATDQNNTHRVEKAVDLDTNRVARVTLSTSDG